MYHIRLLYSIQFTQNLYLAVKSQKKIMCILSVLKTMFFCYNILNVTDIYNETQRSVFM